MLMDTRRQTTKALENNNNNRIYYQYDKYEINTMRITKREHKQPSSQQRKERRKRLMPNERG